MEIEAASTPRGTTPTTNCFSSLSHLRQPPPFQQPQNQLTISSTILPRALKSTLRDNGVVITPHLAPHSEYEVSSSAPGNIFTTTNPNLSLLSRNPLTKSASNPTPSPDSAIHSVYYSPSQSPVEQQSSIQSQSRQLSSLSSSPFSLRTTPASSLSRTNSDASQYGSSSIPSLPSSVSATTSPISSSHQYSPANSPSQNRHHSGGGHPQASLQMQNTVQSTGQHAQQHPPPLLPSSPLPQSMANRTQLSLPPSLHGVVLQRHEDNRRSPAATMSEYIEGSTQDFMEDKTAGISTQPGISRQQLINR